MIPASSHLHWRANLYPLRVGLIFGVELERLGWKELWIRLFLSLGEAGRRCCDSWVIMSLSPGCVDFSEMVSSWHICTFPLGMKKLCLFNSLLRPWLSVYCFINFPWVDLVHRYLNHSKMVKSGEWGYWSSPCSLWHILGNSSKLTKPQFFNSKMEKCCFLFRIV